MKMYPTGPWRAIAACIGTRLIKQVQTHAQKYQQKLFRRQRGLRKQKRKFQRLEHRVDHGTTGSIIKVKEPLVSDASASPSASTMMSSPTSCYSSSTSISPRKQPASMSLAFDAAFDPTTLDCIDVTKLLDGVEPLPFTPMAPEMQVFDEQYVSDLRESIEILLS
ncbi:TPA: hypothetical protein N0F65_001983 [Lagenidium giganteum]|uniref:MYB transcription factor n=1 Tax=Lagenidium giganteum TaxID=4803 RepID=A0AAV2Z2Y0_9STRA|nr:TPA: hypothetical protein N0F65_001983 [Lagenidium giganteum]